MGEEFNKKLTLANEQNTEVLDKTDFYDNITSTLATYIGTHDWNSPSKMTQENKNVVKEDPIVETVDDKFEDEEFEDNFEESQKEPVGKVENNKGKISQNSPDKTQVKTSNTIQDSANDYLAD